MPYFWLNPRATRRALYLVIFPFSSCLCLNTYLQETILASGGASTILQVPSFSICSSSACTAACHLSAFSPFKASFSVLGFFVCKCDSVLLFDVFYFIE